ncbi:MAG: hypothetical protein AAB381_02635 [Patescibacteria group bacterium]
MPRRVQDIVPSDRRSIRDIPIEHESAPKRTTADKPTRRSRTTVEEETPHPAPKTESKEGREIPIRRMPVVPPAKKHSSSKHRFLSWLFISLAVIGIVVLTAWVASAYFSRATFTIRPKVYPITVNGTYIAKGTPSTTLSYELVNFTGSATTTVPSTDGAPVSTKAQGTVTIYNDNAQVQRLVAGSRLSASGGEIYKLVSSVTIPAKTSAGPGKLTTKVIADLAGEEYNLTRSIAGDLSFIGFKGTDKYRTVYAQAATDISGGFVGTKKIVPSSTLATTTAQLKAQLTARLLAQARAVLPEGYIMFDEVYSATFSNPQVYGTDPNQATVSIEGTVTGILFDQKRLVEQIAGKDEVSSFGEFDYTSPGLQDLDVTIANAKDFSPQKKNSLILRIRGALRLVGTVPVDDIRSKLAGVSLNETQDILKPYSPVIEAGSGELIPPWSSVPDDIERISIVIKEE